MMKVSNFFQFTKVDAMRVVRPSNFNLLLNKCINIPLLKKNVINSPFRKKKLNTLQKSPKLYYNILSGIQLFHNDPVYFHEIFYFLYPDEYCLIFNNECFFFRIL